MLAACAAERRCRQRYPDPEALLAKATTTLEKDPLTVSVDHRGASIDVLVTPAFLARALRQLVSDGGSSGPLFAVGSIPPVLDAVAARRSQELSTVIAQLIQYEDPLCLGYRTPCLPAATGSLGVQLTTLCRDIVPGREPDPVALSTVFRRRVRHGLLAGGLRPLAGRPSGRSRGRTTDGERHGTGHAG